MVTRVEIVEFEKYLECRIDVMILMLQKYLQYQKDRCGIIYLFGKETIQTAQQNLKTKLIGHLGPRLSPSRAVRT